MSRKREMSDNWRKEEKEKRKTRGVFLVPLSLRDAGKSYSQYS